MPHPKLTANRTLRTTGASAAALALLALPMAGPVAALSVGDAVQGQLDSVGDDLADILDSVEATVPATDEHLVNRVLEIAERVEEAPPADPRAPEPPVVEEAPAGPTGDPGGADQPEERTMEPAGGSYEPVSEPAPRSAAATAPEQPEPAAAGAASSARTGGPGLQGWSARTDTAYQPVQPPLVAGPMTVPAPAFADPAPIRALTGAVRDGWATFSAWPAGARDPYTPTQWPFAVATGILLLVTGGHALRVYDKASKASSTATG